MERQEAVKLFFDGITKAYIEDQSKKHIRASGASAKAFHNIADNNGGKLFGSGYLYFQKKGRRPGGFPPIESIIKWIKDKKTFNVDSESNLKSLAFLIARKISKTGTDIYKGKRPALSIEERKKELLKELVNSITNSTKEMIINSFKTVS